MNISFVNFHTSRACLLYRDKKSIQVEIQPVEVFEQWNPNENKSYKDSFSQKLNQRNLFSGFSRWDLQEFCKFV